MVDPVHEHRVQPLMEFNRKKLKSTAKDFHIEGPLHDHRGPSHRDFIKA